MTRAKKMKRAVLAIRQEQLTGKNNSFPNAVTDAVYVTEKEKQRAIQYYATGCRPEDILVMSDTAVFSPYKKGMILTEKHFYCDEFTKGAFGAGKVFRLIELDKLKQVKLVDNGDKIQLTFFDGTSVNAYAGIYAKFYMEVFHAVFTVIDEEARQAKQAATESEMDRYLKGFGQPDDEDDKLRREMQRMLDDQSKW